VLCELRASAFYGSAGSHPRGNHLKDLGTLLDDALQGLFKPKPIVRLETVRILAPLAILGFMSTRVAHPADWLASSGFRIPDVADDWRQRAHLPPIDPWAAYTVCVALVISGLATAAGAFTRISSAVFAALLAYVALADRLSAFTVSKIAPVIVLALCVTPSGSRWSVDAWLRKRKNPDHVLPTHVSGGCVSFFQLFLPVFYFSSGFYKFNGDWWVHYNDHVLFTHLHDSYQTPVSWFLANHLPVFSWTVLQWITLVFEMAAPLWFLLPWTRPFAFIWAVSMHAMIGMMFGPVAWFSLLMISLLVASYAPATLLDPSLARAKIKK
jgi:uncharacterized membrane protein YphA (DoxX/SURF4 family)